MSQFTEDMIVRTISDPRRSETWKPPGLLPQNWVVDKDLPYAVGTLEDPIEWIRVPKGFIFNGHSVPFGFRWLFPRAHSIYLQAAAVHDFLYQDYSWHGDRKRADEIYLEALYVLGVNPRWARIMWLGVRIGGWRAWGRSRKERGFIPLSLPIQSTES